jgi:hypothetical protein
MLKSHKIGVEKITKLCHFVQQAAQNAGNPEAGGALYLVQGHAGLGEANVLPAPA